MLVCLAITVVGALVFAFSQSPAGLIVGRLLFGLGSASSLMAPLALFATRFPPERFGTLAGVQIGFGGIGTLLATAPLAWSTALIGWRGSFLAIGVFTVLTIVLVLVFVSEDKAEDHRARRETFREAIGGLASIIRDPVVPKIFAVHLFAYSSLALIAALWGGPYLADVYGYDLETRGNFLLVLAISSMIGPLIWGPMDRWLGNHKLPVILGGSLTAAMLLLLAIAGTLPPSLLVLWFAVYGVMSAHVSALIAHGKAMFPPHLVGRVITLFNMGTMGGVFFAQLVSGIVIDLFPVGTDGTYPITAYRAVFALQACAILLVLLPYLLKVPAHAEHPAQRKGGMQDSWKK
jgi:MFS family permease